MDWLKRSRFFLSQRRERWRWPWLLLGGATAISIYVAITLAAMFWVYALALLFPNGPLAAFIEYFETEESTFAARPGFLLLELLLVGVPFWGAAIAGSLVQGRGLRSLVAPLAKGFRWGLVGRVLLAELLLHALLLLVPIPFFPGGEAEARFTGLGLEHLLWTLPLLAACLVQTSGEDAFFKGYLLRQFGAVTAVCWIAPVMVVGLFVLGHVGNPDLEDNAFIFLPLFVISELVAVYLYLRSGGLEIPLVLHWVNNSLLIFIYAESETQATDLTLWVFDRPEDPAKALAGDLESAISFLVYLILLLGLLLWKRSPFYIGPPLACPPACPPAFPPACPPGGAEGGGPESAGSETSA